MFYLLLFIYNFVQLLHMTFQDNLLYFMLVCAFVFGLNVMWDHDDASSSFFGIVQNISILCHNLCVTIQMFIIFVSASLYLRSWRNNLSTFVLECSHIFPKVYWDSTSSREGTVVVLWKNLIVYISWNALFPHNNNILKNSSAAPDIRNSGHTVEYAHNNDYCSVTTNGRVTVQYSKCLWYQSQRYLYLSLHY